MTICPFCKASFVKGEDVVACLQCGTTHHSICWIDNGNQCTVYRCDGFQEMAKFRFTDISVRPTKHFTKLAIFLIAFNYAFHFFIPQIKPYLNSIPLSEIAIVFTIETSFILSSALLLFFSRRYSGFTYRYDSVRFFAGLVLTTNALFVLGLLLYGLSAGWQSLASAIYF